MDREILSEMSSVRRLVALHYGQHPINFVGVVITNDILVPSRFKSNIHEVLAKATPSKASLLKGRKVILFIKTKLGK